MRILALLTFEVSARCLTPNEAESYNGLTHFCWKWVEPFIFRPVGCICGGFAQKRRFNVGATLLPTKQFERIMRCNSESDHILSQLIRWRTSINIARKSSAGTAVRPCRARVATKERVNLPMDGQRKIDWRRRGNAYIN